MRDPNELMSEYRKESAERRAARRAARMLRVGDAKVYAFEDRPGNFVFVKVPGEYGRYVRTRIAVVLAPCPACKSELGVPCMGQHDRYTGSVHADRLVAARKVLVAMIPGKEGGVGKSIADDDGEPPYMGDDLVHDEEPTATDEHGTIDLRSYFK